MPTKYVFGNKEFKNKEDVVKYIQTRVSNKLLNVRLNKKGEEFMLDLLENHPHAQEKKGVGIDYIYLHKSEYNNKEFCIKRLDGTETIFSYKKCIYPPKYSNRNKCIAAFRKSIEYQIIEFRAEYYSNHTAQENNNLDKTDIHHSLPNSFKKIVEDFILEYNLDFNNSYTLLKQDDDKFYYLIDKELELSFQNFHKKRAVLVLLPRSQHIDIHQNNNSCE